MSYRNTLYVAVVIAALAVLFVMNTLPLAGWVDGF